MSNTLLTSWFELVGGYRCSSYGEAASCLCGFRSASPFAGGSLGFGYPMGGGFRCIIIDR